MAKFLNMWRINPMAVSLDPAEQAKVFEMTWAMLDKAMESGRLLEFGYFPDGVSGYTILQGEAKDAYRATLSYYPWVISDVHEMVPYETGKEISREVMKARTEMMKR
jgi:hypothetical protein